MNMENYDAEHIQVLKGLDPVRQSPGFFIGGSDNRALHHLIWEVVDNAVDEHLAGHCNNILITVRKDGGISVEDDGRGIPVAKHPSENKSALEVVLTTLNAGGKFSKSTYQVSGGLHGVGVAVTNALSHRMIAEVQRDGHLWVQEYKQGIPQKKVAKKKKAKKTGTKITFYPDPEIFPKVKFNPDIVVRRMRETSYLCPGLKVIVEDEINDDSIVLYNKGGIRSYVQFLNEENGQCFPRNPVLFSGKLNGVEVDVSFQYSDQNNDSIVSFCNIINTAEGGNHVSGFKSGMTRAINFWARENNLIKEKESNFSGDDIRDGMTAVISIKMKNPQFEGQTKTKLGNPEVEGILSQISYDEVYKIVSSNVSFGKYIIDRARSCKEARDAAAKITAAIKRKSPFSANKMPEKLADCNHSGDSKDCELYIVEGDSAASGAKESRDPFTQAILPIRGKILNVEKSSLKDILKNREIQAIITAIGVGIIDMDDDEDDSVSFDISKLRYGKVIILADADPDGSHIQTLLVTLFFRYFKPLIENGHLYVAQPPLYSVYYNKKNIYAQDEIDLKKITKNLKGKKYEITRFKGLGEMNPSDLEKVVINPSTRSIARVEIENTGESSKLINALMGSKVELRKEYLTKHAADAYQSLFEEGRI